MDASQRRTRIRARTVGSALPHAGAINMGLPAHLLYACFPVVHMVPHPGCVCVDLSRLYLVSQFCRVYETLLSGAL